MYGIFTYCYLPTFGCFDGRLVGKYTIHGCYGILYEPKITTFDLGLNSLGAPDLPRDGWVVYTPLFPFRSQPLGASFINKSS